MLRWLTAGESHGPALVGIIEGLPAGVAISSQDVRDALARRRLGYGRGARMKFEQDEVSFIGGVRHGLTQGGPVAIEVGNTEWPKWEKVMNPDAVDPEELASMARNAPLTRPRPGHADFTGMQKYGFDDARPVLERACARETAARVALGTVAANFLAQLGVELVSHTVSVGTVASPEGSPLPRAADVRALDADPLRCFDADTSAAMVAEVDAAHKEGETLGGIVEVLAYNLPPGLGSYVHWDRRLDARLAGALMGIQAIKGVEVGDGFLTASRRGSAAHDEIVRGRGRRHRPLRQQGRRHRGRHEHRRRAARARGHEADRHRARAPCAPSTPPPARQPRPTTSARTSVRSRPPASSPRPWSPWCWPRPCWRSSAATRSPRSSATSRPTSAPSRRTWTRSATHEHARSS